MKILLLAWGHQQIMSKLFKKGVQPKLDLVPRYLEQETTQKNDCK